MLYHLLLTILYLLDFCLLLLERNIFFSNKKQSTGRVKTLVAGFVFALTIHVINHV